MNVYSMKTRKGFEEGAEAALRGDYEAVKQKTFHGINLEDTDDNARSLLHYAVLGANLEIVKYLVLNCQMDPCFADKWLITPYDLSNGQREDSSPAFCDIYNVDDLYYKYCISREYDRRPIYDFFREYLGFGIEDCYRNPVLRSFHADPSIVRVEDDYYMVNSSFVYFPGIPISHSRDLVNWELVGYAITDPSWAKEHLGNLEGGRGFWAPDISYHDGRFYICATLRNNDDMEYPQTQIVTSSKDPKGPYDIPVIHNISGIDPSLFTDDDGKRYMLLNRGACLMEVTSDGKKILSKPEMIAYGYSGHAPEGPHLIKKDGYYYCFLAEGGTGRGHMITVLRSKNLRGPYENCPYNPIMTQKDPIAPIQCCGHGKPVMTQDGRWYMVYLCERMIDGKWGMLGRETSLDEITWTLDGWPLVNNRRGPSYLSKLPFANLKDTARTNNSAVKSNAGSIRLQSSKLPYGGWLFSRTYDKDFVKVRDDDTLEVKGDALDLCDIRCRSFAVVNQKDLVCKDEILMEIPFDKKKMPFGEESGIVLYYDENSYIKFAIRRDCEDEYSTIIKEHRDDKYVRENAYKIEFNDQYIFTVITNELKRTFILNGQEIATLSDVTGICSEGLIKGKRFTGATVGAYVFGRSTYLFKKMI